MGAMVYSPDGAFDVSADQFVASARAEWPDADVLWSDGGADNCDVTVQIPDGRGSRWQVFHSSAGEQVWTDGNAEQELQFARWARTLVSADSEGRIILLNDGYSVAANLNPDMTIDEIRAAWRDEPPE